MSTVQRNKALVRKLYEQSLNKRNLGLLRELVAEDYAGLRGGRGAAGFEESVVALINAFPDVRWEVEELMGEGDKVVVRQNVRGTHKEAFGHIPATGKTISSNGMGIYQLKDGKIIKHQIHTDRLDFLQQLDVLPLDLTKLPGRKVHHDQVSFIDKFFVPVHARPAFYERMSMNRNFIKNLPGFVEDVVYEHTDEKGNLVCITVANWASREALESAKEAVQTYYKKQSFNPADMFEQMGITMDRAVYNQTASHH